MATLLAGCARNTGGPRKPRSHGRPVLELQWGFPGHSLASSYYARRISAWADARIGRTGGACGSKPAASRRSCSDSDSDSPPSGTGGRRRRGRQYTRACPLLLLAAICLPARPATHLQSSILTAAWVLLLCPGHGCADGATGTAELGRILGKALTLPQLTCSRVPGGDPRPSTWPTLNDHYHPRFVSRVLICLRRPPGNSRSLAGPHSRAATKRP